MTFRLLILSAFILSGCGIKGDLATPPPVFGKDRVGAVEPVDADRPDGAPEIDAEEPFYGPDIASDYGEDD